MALLLSLRRAASATSSRSLTTRFSSSAASQIQIIESVADFHRVRKQLPATASVGLVPTMGVRPS